MSLLSFLPIIIIVAGTYLLYKLDFFFILHPKRTLKFAFLGNKTKESTLSLMLALAGTLGVGNIIGVSIGLSIGGSGSVFWLILSSVFSAAIKYSEVYLSTYYKNGYGIIGVINNTFNSSGKFLSKIYAALAILLAFSMGCLFQADAISDAASQTGSFSKKILIPILFFAAITVCMLGKDKIKGAVAVIIPIAATIYTGMCLFVIFSEISRLPKVLSSIISAALNFRAFKGGIFAFIIASGMKEGFARGLLSNEAGAGTSSFSHTSHYDTEINYDEENIICNIGNTDNKKERHDTPMDYNTEIERKTEAQRAGVFGILEVFFDTLFLCPLTAFAILLGTDMETFSGSLNEMSKVFSNYCGPFAPGLLLFSIVSFAISTVFCWYYYGKVSVEYIGCKILKIPYSFLFFTLFAAGLLYEVPHVIFITDTVLFFLSLITIYTLIKNRRVITLPSVEKQ